jgi:rhodanese-related sulfurtransferase
MKKLTAYLLALLFATALVFTGCSDDGDDPAPFDAQKALTEYLVEQDMDINKILDGFVMMPPDDGNVSDKYVIDIRSAEDYQLGHIEGAVNSSLGSILDEAQNADKPILVACYTGQTATYSIALLRLAGYTDAKALKWGMSSWHSDFANNKGWNDNKIGNVAEGNANWTYDPAPTNLTYNTPTFNITTTNPVEILNTRIAAVATAGFKTITPDAVIATPQDYFINNYFSEADYLGFGHIDGAKRVQPLLISGDEGQRVTNLDPDDEVVTYCYTGQTSAAISAYLNVLGYNAYSMVFGMNKLYHNNDAWSANKWDISISKDLPYVTN